MSCPDSRGRHRDETLRNSTIARLLLDGKVQEDARPPPMDLSIKKSPNTEMKCSSMFGVRNLLNNSQSNSPNHSRVDPKSGASFTCQTSNSEVTMENKSGSYFEKEACRLDSDSVRANLPDSAADSISRLAMSPFLQIDRPRSHRCSEALRSLLLKPSTLVMNRKSQNLPCSRPILENGIPEHSEVPAKCDFEELAKYFYRGGDRILHRVYAARRSCQHAVEERLPSTIKKEDECPVVKRGRIDVKEVQEVRASDVGGCTPTDQKHFKIAKCKRKIKSESPETSSGSTSTPEPLISCGERRTPSSKIHCSHLAAPDDSDRRFEGYADEMKAGDRENKDECDYDTFRKFKRFRKFLPAPRPDPVEVNTGSCQCNLNNLIQEIKSSNVPSLIDVGTQCLRNFTDASTQYDIPSTVATCPHQLQQQQEQQQVLRQESESENGVTEGVSMAGEVHLKCLHCGITFEDDVIHSIHMGCHCHRDPFICNLCGRQCDNKYVFNTHILRGHQPV